MSDETKTRLVNATENGRRFELSSPTAMPSATAFLWNRKMMLQANCRGFAMAQHLQPEPAKYAHAPNHEATNFMQPEHPYYAHHPGRFVYIKDEESREFFSAPHEPVRRKGSRFVFAPGLDDILWRTQWMGIEVEMRVQLARHDAVEIWNVRIANHSDRERRLSVYPAFTIGYMSWMNQSARYEHELGGVVARSVTPYQKVEDYPRIRELKDQTFLLCDQAPEAWEANRQVFEGEGGLNNPDGLQADILGKGQASYETPLAAVQYQRTLASGAFETFRFLFGPARDDQEIMHIRERYLADSPIELNSSQPERSSISEVSTPDTHFNHFVNHWLPRQLLFHGEMNRLTTDPQTRNLLQDHMGMAFLDPTVTRGYLLKALEQQLEDGNFPDGILLHDEAQLKYINQVPHSDHCVWLPICLQSYLNESGDWAILDLEVQQGSSTRTVRSCLNRALQWLIANRDDRGLSYIAQGDWCDPMNMVGVEGKGVSTWLSLATAYACQTWADISGNDSYAETATEIRSAVNGHLWDGGWFARGITDAGRMFGISTEQEGRIYLNPQSWAILAGAVSEEQTRTLVQAVADHLETDDGIMMLAPPYSRMQDDIGRLTQKSPGVAENGSVYNHAVAFWIFSLFQAHEPERAYQLIQKMIPGPEADTYLRQGQLPVFIPNYYRGIWHLSPGTAGRSSQLVNTGTVAWLYRCLVENLFGLHGCKEGLQLDPQLPSHWPSVTLLRHFRGACFEISMKRDDAASAASFSLDGEVLEQPLVADIETGRHYKLEITLPGRAK